MPTGTNIVKLLLLFLSFPFSNGMRLCGVKTLRSFPIKLILTIHFCIQPNHKNYLPLLNHYVFILFTIHFFRIYQNFNL